VHALVTGGGGGIGSAIAQALTGAGARVTVAGRREAPLAQAVAEGRAASFAVCDVTDPDAVEHAFGEAVAAHGPLDILVNNAGGASSAPFYRTTNADFRAMLDLNLMGCVHACRVALPEMKASGRGRT
jgi:NAD(P)-dependent dehydrogenase (short-subunit alcohol dehydrogenase family)